MKSYASNCKTYTRTSRPLPVFSSAMNSRCPRVKCQRFPDGAGVVILTFVTPAAPTPTPGFRFRFEWASNWTRLVYYFGTPTATATTTTLTACIDWAERVSAAAAVGRCRRVVQH